MRSPFPFPLPDSHDKADWAGVFVSRLFTHGLPQQAVLVHAIGVYIRKYRQESVLSTQK
ncbi:hypothetical protein [Pampinifervens florentissimum]|uniref:hypothetical protein n=1 Tax=Pampinifervens florentissimum TaxID=1632019 RepID=UPI0013B4A041|nr:hypothetical protein [Hydrogenobacter sp. T-8]QID34121.1 hypothetical protein G3M65_10190 [Hydrogenobacter sp. T-8]